jgi:hypothetical protein
VEAHRAVSVADLGEDRPVGVAKARVAEVLAMIVEIAGNGESAAGNGEPGIGASKARRRSTSKN